MIAVLGALFIVGTVLSFFLGTTSCGKVDLDKSPRQGAMWALLPAIVYMLTGSPYAMVVSTWIPTLVLIYTTEQTICLQGK
jgi:hypothetical protein